MIDRGIQILTTEVIPAIETDTLDYRFGEHVESSDDFVGVHPEHNFQIVQVRGAPRGTRLGGSSESSTRGLDWGARLEGARFGSLRCTNSTGLPGGLMQHYLFFFYLAAFNGGVCGAAAAVGFIIRRPQTSLEAARPTLWATTAVVSLEKVARKHDGAHHTTLTRPLRR